MAEEDLDPAADTQMFQAFVDRRELDEEQARTRGLRSLSAHGHVTPL